MILPIINLADPGCKHFKSTGDIYFLVPLYGTANITGYFGYIILITNFILTNTVIDSRAQHTVRAHLVRSCHLEGVCLSGSKVQHFQ